MKSVTPTSTEVNILEGIGSIRTAEIDGVKWYFGIDVVKFLGFKDSAHTIRKYVDSQDIMMKQGIFPNALLINERGLYALIWNSKSTKATAFKKWLSEGLIPQLQEYSEKNPSSGKKIPVAGKKSQYQEKNPSDWEKNPADRYLEALSVAGEMSRIFRDDLSFSSSWVASKLALEKAEKMYNVDFSDVMEKMLQPYKSTSRKNHSNNLQLSLIGDEKDGNI